MSALEAKLSFKIMLMCIDVSYGWQASKLYGLYKVRTARGSDLIYQSALLGAALVVGVLLV